jgi:hypothetical protein
LKRAKFTMLIGLLLIWQACVLRVVGQGAPKPEPEARRVTITLVRWPYT